MLDILLKQREFEDEKVKLQLVQSNVQPADIQDKIQQYQTEMLTVSNPQQQMNNITVSCKHEFVNFKGFKEGTTTNKDGAHHQKAQLYSSYLSEIPELTYKLIKCEAKLMRATLESNGFVPTEGHDWNLLWSSQSYKQFIYDNLSDF